MKILMHLLKKEFLQIRRNKFLARFIFIMPIIQLAILPWAATFEQKNINLSIVDNDRSTSSKQMIEKISSSGYFNLLEYASTYNEALSGMEKQGCDIILEIPNDFEKNITINQPLTLLTTINAVNGQKAGVGMSYISQIIQDFNTDLNVQNRSRGIQLKPYYRYNRDMNYRVFMVPGILVMLITIIGGISSALNIVREKEIGTIEQINVTPVPKYIFILAKLIPFWIIGLTLLSIGMIVAWLLYGLIPVGHIVNIYMYGLLYLMAFTGLGLVVSNFATSQQQAMFMIFFFFMIFILLSGLFSPIASMPVWAQRFTLINPIRYFIEVMRLIYMKGSGFSDLVPYIFKMIGFVIFFNVLAVLTYKKTN